MHGLTNAFYQSGHSVSIESQLEVTRGRDNAPRYVFNVVTLSCESLSSFKIVTMQKLLFYQFRIPSFDRVGTNSK